MVSHGSHAPPVTFETVHTTQKHPWLTARGWITAGQLHLGDQVRQLDGTTATVVALNVIHGTADMYDLTVSNVHTFAVGIGQFVVHNCGGNPPDGWVKDTYESDPLDSPSTTRLTEFTHVNWRGDTLTASFYEDTGELQVSWLDRLGQARTHLPPLINWLGSSVKTVSGMITDNLYETYFSNDEASQSTLNVLNKMASSVGFGPGSLEQNGVRLWLRFMQEEE